MARSKKRTPIAGNAAGSSDKPGKKQNSKIFRGIERRAGSFIEKEVGYRLREVGAESLEAADYAEMPVLPKREGLNTYSMPKDGKRYFGGLKPPAENQEAILEKQRKAFQKLMRK